LSGNAAGQSSSAGMQPYTIDYAVSPEQVHFSRNGDVRHAILDFLLSAYADNGSITFHLELQTTVNLTPADYRQAMLSGLRLHREIDIPVNSSSLRLGVEDENGARVGTMELPLPVKAPADQVGREAHKMPLEPN